MKQSVFIKKLYKIGNGYSVHIPIDYVKEFGADSIYTMRIGIDGSIHLKPEEFTWTRKKN